MHTVEKSADAVHNADDVDMRESVNASKRKKPTVALAVASEPHIDKADVLLFSNPDHGKKENGSSRGDHPTYTDEGQPSHTLSEVRNHNSKEGPKTNCYDVVGVPYQSERIQTPSEFLRWRRRRKNLTSADYWTAADQKRVIGLGTVGLFQDRTSGSLPPGEASACVNGTIIVGPPGYVRKVKDYIGWREKHSDLFSTLRNQDEKERQYMRLRRLHEKARQQEEEEYEYASAVRRLRKRGWSVLGNAPRQVDHTRFNQIKAEREAFRAECEENVVRRIKEASKQRETISQQIASFKEEKARQENIVRDAARQEREVQNAKREEHLALLKERAANTRAIVEEEREFIRECAVAESKYRQNRNEILRERVFAKTYTGGLLTNLSNTMYRSGRQYPLGDWRNTFKSPLQRLPNASDDAFRKQWVMELQEERRAVARAEVERTKRLLTSAQREAAYRDNCERAEALRKEKDALRERKRQQCEEVELIHKVLRQQEAEGQKRREEVLRALRESKRETASIIRQAIEEEEMMFQTLEDEELRQLQERVAQMKKNKTSPTRMALSPFAERVL
ncbi:hypothetical protein MOQ_010255 [Trypanosoma cruzi marinkellei]|uniref:Uncharacterized protein n=1 Tax=Trypanosoma cruzi marinkellei TaxID=85056 RepID=K2LTN8_TRYCR|nr:hypothetical protein MOQ_010255 [Trypanosoma cruzi marinkellei]